MPTNVTSQCSPATRGRLRAVIFWGILLLIPVLVLEIVSFLCLYFSGFRFRALNQLEYVVDELPNNLQAHERYIWLNKPHSQFQWRRSDEDITMEVQINSQGFRDEEESARSGADFKFVALGDSFTFGYLVQHQDRWDEQLAKIIEKQHGIRASSVNLGAYMSTFDQHALFLEDLLPDDCKLVIHLVYPSHLQTINRHFVTMQNDKKILAAHDPLLHIKDGRLFYGADSDSIVSKSLFVPFSWCFLNFQYNNYRLKHLTAQRGAIPVTTDQDIYCAETQELFTNAWNLTDRALRQIADYLKARNISYLVVVIPRDLQLSAEEWNEQDPVDEVLRTSVPQDRFERLAKETEWASFLDLTPAMRANYHPRLYFKKDPHWRPEGHRFAAECIYQQLIKQRSLPTGQLSTLPTANR